MTHRTATLACALLATLALALALPAAAHTEHAGHDGAQGAPHAAVSHPLSTGVVTRVNKDQGKLTIRHGPLENLGMPAMTMIFRAPDATLLDRVKPGDSIRFRAERVRGNFIVTHVETGQ